MTSLPQVRQDPLQARAFWLTGFHISKFHLMCDMKAVSNHISTP